MGRPRGPLKPTGEERKNHPSLFDWAESIAARLGATLDDVSLAALSAAPLVFFGLFTCWINSHEDSPLRPVLALTTFGALACSVLAWVTRALHSRLKHKGVPIALHTLALVGTIAVVLGVAYSAWEVDRARIALRAQVTAKEEAEKRAANEAAEKARVAEEKAKLAEREAARALEEECQRARSDAMEKVKGVVRIAKTKLDECRTEHANLMIKMQSVDAYCRTPQDQFAAAKAILNVASGRICSTAGISKGK